MLAKRSECSHSSKSISFDSSMIMTLRHFLGKYKVTNFTVRQLVGWLINNSCELNEAELNKMLYDIVDHMVTKLLNLKGYNLRLLAYALDIPLENIIGLQTRKIKINEALFLRIFNFYLLVFYDQDGFCLNKQQYNTN